MTDATGRNAVRNFSLRPDSAEMAGLVKSSRVETFVLGDIGMSSKTTSRR
jgi:hypothetical protein